MRLNKFLIVLVSASVLAILGFLYQIDTRVEKLTPRLGISSNDIGYSNVSNTSTTCSGAAGGTLIVATTTGRTSFTAEVSTTATSTVWLCKSSACGIDGGISLPAGTGQTSSMQRYVQTDGYIGPYSCIVSTASTTLLYTHSK